MKNLIKILKIFLEGIFAGIAIGIGGWLYLKTRDISSNLILAAFLFPIGLILICNFGFFLYTGKICYLFDKSNQRLNPPYYLRLIIGIIGNYLGALLMGTIFKLANNVPNFVYQMIDSKIEYEWWKTIILGFLCGMLIYFAVEGFNRINNNFGKYVVLVLCVAGFIICGFEHCIANMFYFSIDNQITFKSIMSIILVIIGNSLGGLFIPLLRKLFNEEKVD